MDDLDMLRTLAGPEPVPSSDGQTRARAALLERARTAATATGEQRNRWGRLGWRITVPVVAAAVVVAGVVAAENAGPVGKHGGVDSVVPSIGAPPVNAAEAVWYAADAAAKKPFTWPRADQWLFRESRVATSTKPGGAVTGGPNHIVTIRSWMRIDGTQAVTYEDGKLVKTNTAQPARRDGRSHLKWAELAALPANPDAVLAWVRKQNDAAGSGESANEFAFETISYMLRQYLLPPAVEAAFFRALSELPGVTLVPGTVNIDGRETTAVARVTEGWLRHEILLDPKTYALVGERSVAIADHTGTGLDGTQTVRKGTVQQYEVRVAAAIVDKPGQTG
jgi:hypothetical protein